MSVVVITQPSPNGFDDFFYEFPASAAGVANPIYTPWKIALLACLVSVVFVHCGLKFRLFEE